LALKKRESGIRQIRIGHHIRRTMKGCILKRLRKSCRNQERLPTVFLDVLLKLLEKVLRARPQLDLASCIYLPPEIDTNQEPNKRAQEQTRLAAQMHGGNTDPASRCKAEEREDYQQITDHKCRLQRKICEVCGSKSKTKRQNTELFGTPNESKHAECEKHR